MNIAQPADLEEVECTQGQSSKKVTGLKFAIQIRPTKVLRGLSREALSKREPASHT